MMLRQAPTSLDLQWSYLSLRNYDEYIFLEILPAHAVSSPICHCLVQQNACIRRCQRYCWKYITGFAANTGIKILLKSPQISRSIFTMESPGECRYRIEPPRQADCPHLWSTQVCSDTRSTTNSSLCGRNRIQIRGYIGPDKQTRRARI